jgi:hypothetical protein
VPAPAVGVPEIHALASRQRRDLLVKDHPRAGGKAVRVPVIPHHLFAPGLKVKEHEPRLPEIPQRAIDPLPKPSLNLDKARWRHRREQNLATLARRTRPHYRNV